MEQRIGRCHRYGQKIDVTVVNMLNRKNRAEARIYQLLDEKFHLFQGVFGTSDQVLGTIESGVDIQQRIFEVVQSARTAEEIDTAFDKLQADLGETIDETFTDARKRLLDNLDMRIVERLKSRKGELLNRKNAYQQDLLRVAHGELSGLAPHPGNDNRFDYQGQTWTVEWPLAEEKGMAVLPPGGGHAGGSGDPRGQGPRLHCTPRADLRPVRDAGPVRRCRGACKGSSGWLQVSTSARDRQRGRARSSDRRGCG